MPSRRQQPEFVLLVDCLPMLPGGENGGAKWAAIGIIESLLAVRPTWRIIVLAAASVADELRRALPGAEIMVALDSGGLNIGSLRLPRLHDGQRVQAILCPFVGPQVVHPEIPILSIVYDIQFHYYPTFFSVDDLATRARNIVAAIGQSDRIICAAQASRDSLLEVYSVPSDKLAVIPLRMADRLPVAGDGANLLKTLGLKPQGYLLYPANSWLHKNHAMLLTAYALYRRNAGDAALKLVCTGMGNRREDDMIRDAIDAMGLRDQVVLPGFASEAELAQLLDNALAMIFPSLFEGFGMPVLEAMQRGVPVLCGKVPSLLELAGDTAYYFDNRIPSSIAEAIMTVQRDPALRADLIRRGSLRAAPYTDRQAMGEAFALALNEMAQQRNLLGGAGAAVLVPFNETIRADAGALFHNLLGDGWAVPEQEAVWSLGERSSLFLSTQTATSARLLLSLEFSPFHNPQADGQRLALYVNRQLLLETVIRQHMTVTVAVPAAIWNAGLPTEVVLLHPDCESPSNLGDSPDERSLSLRLHAIRIDQVD